MINRIKWNGDKVLAEQISTTRTLLSLAVRISTARTLLKPFVLRDQSVLFGSVLVLCLTHYRPLWPAIRIHSKHVPVARYGPLSRAFVVGYEMV